MSAPLGPAGNNVRRNIRRLRERHQWSYREMEDRLARTGRAISALDQSAIDTGERLVTVDDLVALASVFGVDVQELLEPPADCQTCHGAPPAGFICMECETSALPARPAGVRPGA